MEEPWLEGEGIELRSHALSLKDKPEQYENIPSNRWREFNSSFKPAPTRHGGIGKAYDRLEHITSCSVVEVFVSVLV